jgi:hypothetical protein
MRTRRGPPPSTAGRREIPVVRSRHPGGLCCGQDRGLGWLTGGYRASARKASAGDCKRPQPLPSRGERGGLPGRPVASGPSLVFCVLSNTMASPP